MNRPDPKDYPPLTPHDLEWGGIGSKYYEDLGKWEAENDSDKKLFEKIVYWTKEEVECYNVGVEHCIEVVNRSRLPIIGHPENYIANKIVHEIYLKLCELKKPLQ